MKLFKNHASILRLACPVLALILLILAWVFRSNAAAAFVLSILSFLVSLFVLREELIEAIRSRDFCSGLLLLVLAGLICICTGKAVWAALAMLIRLAAEIALPLLRTAVLRLLDTRRSLNPLREQLPGVQSEAALVQPFEQMLQSYFTYLMVLLSAAVAVFFAVAAKLPAAEALSRAAVVLALGGTFPLFSAFPLSDYAAALSAGESGVLFRKDTLNRLMDLKLALAHAQEPMTVGSAAVFPARPEAVGPELMLRLAATACADTDTEAAERLAAVSKNTSTAEIRRQVLPGLGIVARIKDIAVLVGSAEFMKRSGLSVLPFPENSQVLHMGVNGHYVGCIDFSETQQAGDGEKALENAGFFLFRDEQEANEKRLPGEKLLCVLPAAETASGEKEDLRAAVGVLDRFDQITVERCGNAGIAALTEQLGFARFGRKGILLVALIVKAFLFLLTVLGICPLWLAVLLESAAAAFTYRCCVRLLDNIGKY